MARTDTRPSWAGIMFFLSILMFLIAKAVAGLLIGSIISALLLPPSLVLYYITSLAQTSRKRADSKGIAKFRRGLTDYIAAGFFSMCITSLELLLIFKLSPGLKHRNIYDQPISKWAAVSAIICIFGYCTMKVRLHAYEWLEPGNVSDNRFHLREGLTGLINCGLILSAELSVTRVAPVLKQTTILDLQARKWVHVILIVILAHNAIRVMTSLAVGRLRAHFENTTEEQKHEMSPSPNTPGEQKHEPSPSPNTPEEQKKDPLFKCGEDLKEKNVLDFLLPNEETRKWIEIYVVYFSEGLSRSVNFLVTTLLLLLTWIFYFGSRLNRKSASIREGYDYITWTLVCVFVISIFWLVKDAIVLSWEARVVYNKFHVGISDWSTHLWLLGILGGPEFDILYIHSNNRHGGLDQDNGKTNAVAKRDGEEQCQIKIADDKRDDKIQQGPTNTEGERDEEEQCQIKIADDERDDKIQQRPTNTEGERDGEDQDERDDHKASSASCIFTEARKILVQNEKDPVQNKKDPVHNKQDPGPPAHTIMQKAAYFLAAEGPLSKKNYVSDFCKKLHRINGRIKLYDKTTPIKGLDSRELGKEDDQRLRKAIEKISPNNSFYNWIVRAHKSSLALGRSLSGAKEVVDSLNQIIAWLIIGVMIVVWLLLTGIATTKVFVLVASPVLAASFIFGDTCKTFFEGILFAYVLHPFTVGDRCTIGDSSEMEVMRIGIWRTIFSKVGSMGEEVVYPNSVLATEPIVNIRDIDPDDYVEVSPISSTNDGSGQIDNVKSDIERFVRRDPSIKLRHPGVVPEPGADYLEVHFKHDEAKFSDMSSTEIHECKRQMREKLEQVIRSCLDYNYVENVKDSNG